VERVAVPFDGSTLPAYFAPSLAGEGVRPAVIFLCGLDTTKELSFLRVRRHFANRGMHCLAVDTPGIGEVLRHQKVPTRYDYEKPIGAIIDYLLTRGDVDPQNIGIVGSSLGGYYVSRAAAFDHRLKAAVAWGVIFDYHAVWQRRLTVGGTVAAPSFQLMFVTGTQSTDAAMRVIENFKVASIGGRIRCPFLIVHGAEDQQVPEGDAQRMFDAIGSTDKELKIFSGEDGGAAHCQFDNHLPAVQYVGDWLQRKLGSA
jgi:dienelactone hydrolase